MADLFSESNCILFEDLKDDTVLKYIVPEGYYDFNILDCIKNTEIISLEGIKIKLEQHRNGDDWIVLRNRMDHLYA